MNSSQLKLCTSATVLIKRAIPPFFTPQKNNLKRNIYIIQYQNQSTCMHHQHPVLSRPALSKQLSRCSKILHCIEVGCELIRGEVAGGGGRGDGGG